MYTFFCRMNKIREVKSVVAAELHWETGSPSAVAALTAVLLQGDAWSAVVFRIRIPLRRKAVQVVTLT